MKMQRRHRVIQALVGMGLIWGLAGSRLPALEVPPLTGRVNDTAAMLSAATRLQLEVVLS